MASSTHDVILVGAGHNTLTTAAYLALCGVSVLVLEKNAGAGGGAISREATLPGFVHDIHATGVAHLMSHPIVTQDELGLLSKYGLKFVTPGSSFMSVFDDGDTITCFKDLDRTCAEIARFSPKDADRYREMVKFMSTVMPMIGMSMARPPVAFGSFLGFLEKMPGGQDLIVAMMKSAYDVICENFEHPKVRIHFLKWAGETLCGPEEKTTGVNMFFLIGGSHSHPAGAVLGGTQKLTDAMLRCIEDNGGEIRVGCEVKQIINSGGEAKSVVLASGEVLQAKKAIVAGIHPHVLGDMIAGLDAGLVDRAKKTMTSSFANIVVHAALKERVQWKVGEQPNDCLTANLVDYSGLDDFRKVFDDMKYGELPKSFMGGVLLHSNYDPSRAPAGRHAMYCNVFVPFELKNGGAARWDEIKESRADWVMERLQRYCPNLTSENVLARYVESPLDHQRHTPSFQRGDIMGLGSFIYQSLGMRPTAELAQYRVPGAKGLYLAGPFMHPGGGITGGGRAVAIRIMEDLGVKYDKVIRS
jgi:phytoene dehydrogenase-like protein